MAWERRGSGTYYYRASREDGRVKKLYVGNGAKAHQAALEDQQRAEAHRQQREDLKSLHEELMGIETLAASGQGDFRDRAERHLAESGYHYHRGTWRKRRAQRTHR